MGEEQQPQEEKESFNEDVIKSVDQTVDDLEEVVKKSGKSIVKMLTKHGYEKLDELWQSRKAKIKNKVKEGLEKDGESED